jgi:hypothetical protein
MMPAATPCREPITTPTPTLMTTAAAIGTKQPIGSNATTSADSSNSGTPSPSHHSSRSHPPRARVSGKQKTTLKGVSPARRG